MPHPESRHRMPLDRLDHLPAALQTTDLRHIRQVLPHPTLISIPGHRPEPLFISTLLHGNETTSFFVLQDLARRYAASPPPRSLMIFVGNVDAATAGVRRLDSQEDFNRIWSGGDGDVFELAREVTDAARSAGLFASIDIHNNTGANPLYGCVSALQPTHLQLAALFSRVAVYYRNPPTTQSIAFSEWCPALTIECGRSGDIAGIERAIALVNDVLHLDHLPATAPPAGDLSLFHTIGRVLIDPLCSFSFGEAPANLELDGDLERLNFSEMAAGATWGRLQGDRVPLRVIDEHGSDLTAEFFEAHDGFVRLKRTMTPSMITRDRDVIRQDCLAYLMTPIHLDGSDA